MSSEEIYQQSQQVEPGKGGEPSQLTSNLRSSYAKMLQDGHTLGPDDFHDAYHGAGFPEIPDLKNQLPSNQELLDHSIETLRRSSMPISPETVHQTRANILDHWAATGTLPDTNDGPTADVMARQPGPTQYRAHLQALIPQLEGSGDNEISPKGAIGRNQIMPDTARMYGFDPAQLTDRNYNNTVRNTILDDLSKRFHGEQAAVLIAYNAGPGTAERWIKSGRDSSMLPEETQKYLRHAAKLDDLMTPGRDAIYDPMGTLGAENKAPINIIPGVDLGKIMEAAGLPSWAEQQAQVVAKVKQMEEEGASKAEQMSYEALHSPFSNLLGVGSIGDVVGAALLKTFRTPTAIADIRLNQGAKDFVQSSVREATGEGRMVTSTAAVALEEFRKVVNKGIPEFKDWLATKPGRNAPFWQDAPDIMKLLDHIENAMVYEKNNMLNGVSGSRLSSNSPLFPVAEAIRGVNQSLRTLIEQQNPNMQNFKEDYYRHLWTDPSAADKLFSPGRQGSGASLKLRTVPTIAEGIQYGLTPRILDPIENTLHYASGMANFLMSQRVLEEGKTAGYVHYFMPGKEPGGWEVLEGRSATIGHPGIPGATLRYYAPPGYARSYNAWVGGGFYEWPLFGPIYPKLQQASNFMTGMKLSLSGFHALNIMFENTASAISNATGEMLNGEVLKGFRDLGWGVTMIGPGITQAFKGGRLQRAYLNLGAHPNMQPSTLDEQLASIYAKVGGRALGRGNEFGWNQAVNWGQAWERGALEYELKHNFGNVRGSEKETKPMRGLLAGPRLAGTIGKEVGRVMSTITAPLFDKYIPKVKMAAWADAMSTWLRANPMATEDAVLRQGRYLSDSMDDRFGELVQDNLFWPRALKQTFNLATVSVGWEFGTVRAAYRAAKEIGNLNFRGEYARWAFSYAATLGLASAAFQYLLTGHSILETGMPLPGTYYTGGKTVGGKPEIGLLPGIQKDVFQWYHLIQSAPDYTHIPNKIEGYAVGKLNPFWQMTTGFVENRDWKGDPVVSNIRNPETWGLPSHWKQLGDYIMEAFTPIGVEIGEQMKPGTNIDKIERLLGIRPAPEWMQDPERIENITRHTERKEYHKEHRQQTR